MKDNFDDNIDSGAVHVYNMSSAANISGEYRNCKCYRLKGTFTADIR
jgi:hypothetical protein